MRRLAVLLVALVPLAACPSGGLPPPPAIISQAVDCGKADVKAKLPAIADKAATCLLASIQGNAFACLGALVDVAGDTAVVCGVKLVSGEARVRMASGGGDQPNASRISVNGDAYLAARGVRFSVAP